WNTLKLREGQSSGKSLAAACGGVKATETGGAGLQLRHILPEFRLETDLADGVAASEVNRLARGARGLIYPFAQPPGSGEAVQITDDVLWMRLAMPIALDHINVYAVRDGEGWVVVDTGLNLPASRDEWDALLAGPLGGRP